MKIGIVSDVHNNTEALCYVLDALRGCELILCLGDLVTQYHVAPETLRLARDAHLNGILGNHEKTILAPCGLSMRNRLAHDDLTYLQGIPSQRQLRVDGRVLLAAHGSPWDDPDDIRCNYIFHGDVAALDQLGSWPADIILLGHTHIAMAINKNDTLILNPGSCGEGRDAARRLTFAELDFGAARAVVYEVRPGVKPEPMLEATC